MALIKNDKEEYVSVLGNGTLRIVVPKGTEGAVEREYETSDGKKGVKYELIFNSLVGKITDVKFFDGDFGKLIQAVITDGEGSLTLSLPTNQNFGEDFMKKLPVIDLEKEVKITPYSFEDEKGKTRKGLTIEQDGKKIQNFFYDAEKKANINKYPNPKGDTKEYDSDDWKMYFMEARKFLTKYVEDNIIPKFVKNEDLAEDF